MSEEPQMNDFKRLLDAVTERPAAQKLEWDVRPNRAFPFMLAFSKEVHNGYSSPSSHIRVDATG